MMGVIMTYLWFSCCSPPTECMYRKRLSVDGKQTNLQLYEPCSQACDGKSTVKEQISWADGFIVVYDISDRSSFLTAKAIMQLIRELRYGLRSLEPGYSLIFLVGNKQDLCHRREVQREEAQCLAAQCQCQFYELSAAEHHQELALIFSKMVQNASLGSKAKERRRRPSGSRSMAKLINNVFGKRRKSV
uniref:small monomeric GTPase n=1 Tax=Sander lucioperca TaxID=283035 RepID=A0A8C9Z963_SANLU